MKLGIKQNRANATVVEQRLISNGERVESMQPLHMEGSPSSSVRHIQDSIQLVELVGQCLGPREQGSKRNGPIEYKIPACRMGGPDIAKRHILAVLSKNESGAAAVLNLLKLAGLAEYFSAIWTTPYRSLVPCGVYQASPGQWEVFEPPLMDDRFVRLQPLSPESVILIDDERENLQSPLGKQALRYCKVARYDEVYRNCGPLNQLGGIGAHSEEDFETLKAFIAEPWAFQEPSFEKEQGEEGADSQLHCTSRTAWPRQNRRIEETPLEALAMLIVAEPDASRMSSRSEELRKLPRSRLSRSNSSPSLRDAPRLPGMSRSQSFCSSPHLDIADPGCHTPEFSLTGID
eukprot:s519_g29.t1